MGTAQCRIKEVFDWNFAKSISKIENSKLKKIIITITLMTGAKTSNCRRQQKEYVNRSSRWNISKQV